MSFVSLGRTCERARRYRKLSGTSAIGAATGALLLNAPAAYAQTEATSPQPPAQAQTASTATSDQQGSTTAETAFADIVVTATKRGPTNVQDVPAAITAFGERELEAQNFRNLTSLTNQLPNVQLDSMGVTPGFANFSIRGQGFTNSQLTLEPTVGIFVDGVYQGVNAGVISENFDVAGVEVLRGPQGLLFGRNVTGGAVLLRTTDPTMSLTGNIRASIESGPNYTLSGVVSGPVADGLAVKLAALYNRDEGYFTDTVDGTDVDRSHTFVIRPALLWRPASNVKLAIRAEHGENAGNAPANKNLGVYPIDNFQFANNVHGPYRSRWNQVTGEINIDVGFGHGTITDIAGWRNFREFAAQDSDSTVQETFSAIQRIRQEQFSNELRYAGTFGDLAVTTGIFYFWQNPSLVESRFVLGSRPSGGGIQRTNALGIFASADWSLSPQFILNLGARYNRDEKSAIVTRIAPGGCTLPTLTEINKYEEVCTPSFSATEAWSDLSPRVGFQWKPRDRLNFYGYYTKGYRSGGFPLRQTALRNPPGTPFDPEVQHAFELGFKGDFFDRRLRMSGAVFYDIVNGLQRAVSVQDINVGTVQTLTNTADADISGAELEASVAVTSHLVISGSLGYLHSKFQQILYDISGDGVVNQKDYALQLPRFAPWTYGITLNHDLPLPIGTLSTRVSYNHRDSFFSDDANLAPLPARNQIDANMTLAIARSGLELSIYGRNLTNQVTADLRTPLPNIPAFGGVGAAIYPINKGRVLGAEMRYRF